MDFGSLIRTLEWAYWKQQKKFEKVTRKRARKGVWMTKKSKTKSIEEIENVDGTKKEGH